MKRNQVVMEARSWLGTKYTHQGRLKGVGVDCIGLIEGIARAFAIPFEDVLWYSANGNGKISIASEFAKWMSPINVHQAIAGDVIGFWLRNPEYVCHCGIKTDIGVIHTHSRIGAVAEHSIDGSWNKRIGLAFRFREIED